MSQAAALGGRGLLCKLNRDALKEIFSEDLVALELVPKPVGSAINVARAFRGQIDGIDRASLEHLLTLIQSSPTRQVFIDGSNLGEVARAVKQLFPDVEVVTFFHNVEARFFLGALRQTPNLRALGVLLANYLAERKAVHHSDKLVTLSERDSLLLRRIYGRHATHVTPMALRDRSGDFIPEGVPEEKFALFVGGAFYANQAGIAWYADQVAPRLRIKTYVVGHGLEKMKERLEKSGTIEVVGSVPSLAGWYRHAHVVVAPIFDGSGMKTKVAEALMFGKRVIGTPEAFSGYEDALPVAGEICRTAEDFVAALHRSLEEPFCALDEKLRALYERNYSYPAARQRLDQILAV
jgi:glycosyltransferase involved in cell wall biosynthesis